MRIHVSDSTKILLDSFGNFMTEERGMIDIKVNYKISDGRELGQFYSKSSPQN